MAGGVGTGLILNAYCFCCDFRGAEEVDFQKNPTEEDISSAIDRLLKKHKERSPCAAPRPTFWLYRGHPYRLDIGAYTIPCRFSDLIVGGM